VTLPALAGFTPPRSCRWRTAKWPALTPLGIELYNQAVSGLQRSPSLADGHEHVADKRSFATSCTGDHEQAETARSGARHRRNLAASAGLPSLVALPPGDSGVRSVGADPDPGLRHQRHAALVAPTCARAAGQAFPTSVLPRQARFRYAPHSLMAHTLTSGSPSQEETGRQRLAAC